MNPTHKLNEVAKGTEEVAKVMLDTMIRFRGFVLYMPKV